MCCPLDQLHGKLVIQSADFKTGIQGKKDSIHLHGIYDRTPASLADRVFRIFQRLELIEKIAEVADESFHLFGSNLQSHASVSLYQTFHDLHHAAHTVEHLLHSICFVGDLSRMLTGKFLEYHQDKKRGLDLVRCAARVCQTASHFLATVQFLADHKLVNSNRFEPYLNLMPLFSATGYAIWSATLIWRRNQGEKNERFASDLSIHLGGFLFEAIPLAKYQTSLVSYSSILNKLSALAGIIHAWNVIDQLMPPDQEAVKAKYLVPNHFFSQSPKGIHSPHHDDHSHHQEESGHLIIT